MSDSGTHPELGTRSGCVLSIVCVGALVAAAAWAFWPMTPAEVHVTEESKGTLTDAHARPVPPPLDLAAFAAPLWIVEAPPPPPPPVPPPPPPLKLQLLAIVREGNTHKAAIYDPDTDTLLVVGAGEKIGPRVVQSVASDGVEIRDGTRKHRLALNPEEGGRR